MLSWLGALTSIIIACAHNNRRTLCVGPQIAARWPRTDLKSLFHLMHSCPVEITISQSPQNIIIQMRMQHEPQSPPSGQT
ncbi:hypothetical protein EDD22DRAFT_87092 [Suillus occidentalis]|nr:hypothetical protein EDD22DRAFT_87092 [Suillus occidentalis]